MRARLMRDTEGICSIEVESVGGRFEGTVVSPINLTFLALFKEYEFLVNTQCFTNVDLIEKEIERLAITVKWEHGVRAVIEDLQVWPSTSQLSFVLKSTAGDGVQ